MKLKHLMLIAAPALILGSCGKKIEDTPQAVTVAFFEYVADKDYDGAADLCTKSTAEAVKAIGLFASFTPEKTIEKKEVKCKVEGDKAKCKICCMKGEGEQTYRLRKEDGSWKIEYSLFGGGSFDVEETTESLKSLSDSLTNMVDSLKGAVEKVQDATGN